jgi:phosphatidylglycerophosphate synthase
MFEETDMDFVSSPAAPLQTSARGPGFKDATRVLESPLAKLEKRTLIWLAHRMPARVNSDHLTLLALAAMIGAGLSYWLASVTPIGLLLVIVFLAINWFGDSLDGTLARVRNQQRPRYGFYVDHVVDATGAVCLFGGLALSGYMTPMIALMVLVAYMLLSIEVYLGAYSVGTFRITHFNLGPTELRILLAFGNLALLVHPHAGIFGRQFRLFDVGGVVAIAALLVTFAVATARNVRTLYRAEPIPRRDRP